MSIVAGAVPVADDVSDRPVASVEAVKLQSLPSPLTITLPLPPFTLIGVGAGANEKTQGGSSRLKVSGRLPMAPATSRGWLTRRDCNDRPDIHTVADPTPPSGGFGVRLIGQGDCCQWQSAGALTNTT